MFRNYSPFLVILGRINIILLERLVLDGLAQTVEYFHAGILNALYIPVGECEVIRLRLVGVLGKIRENDGHIHHMFPIRAIAGSIVIAGIPHVGGTEIACSAGIYLLGIIDARSVVHGIHTLDGADGGIRRNDNLCLQHHGRQETQKDKCNTFHTLQKYKAFPAIVVDNVKFFVKFLQLLDLHL